MMLRVENQKGEYIFQTMLILVLSAVSIVTVYPFLNVFARSLSTGTALVGRTIGIVPVEFTLENYRSIFTNSRFTDAMYVTVLRTMVGTLCDVAVVGLAAYACSKRSLRGKRFFMTFFLIPMYFGGGLLPTYILITQLGLRNNFLVYILPSLFNTYNFLIMLTYFKTLPESFEESAKIDGASHPMIFAKIIFPLSLPMFATITLFTAVGHWNSWFDTVLYVTKSKLFTLQPLLQNIIQENDVSQLLEKAKYGQLKQRDTTITSEAIRMATICATIVPILCVYPFLQKYFVKGVMIGGIKG